MVVVFLSFSVIPSRTRHFFGSSQNDPKAVSYIFSAARKISLLGEMFSWLVHKRFRDPRSSTRKRLKLRQTARNDMNDMLFWLSRLLQNWFEYYQLPSLGGKSLSVHKTFRFRKKVCHEHGSEWYFELDGTMNSLDFIFGFLDFI